MSKNPKQRKIVILEAALQLARSKGYDKITRDDIAKLSNCSTGLVSLHFGTMNKLRRAIMSAAIARRDLPIIAQGLAAGDSKARTASPSLKREAAEGLL